MVPNATLTVGSPHADTPHPPLSVARWFSLVEIQLNRAGENSAGNQQRVCVFINEWSKQEVRDIKMLGKSQIELSRTTE